MGKAARVPTAKKLRVDTWQLLVKLRNQVHLPHGANRAGVFLLHFGLEYYYIAPFYRSSSCRQMRCIKCNKKGLKKYDIIKGGREVMHRRCFCHYILRVQAYHAHARRIRQEAHWEMVKDKDPRRCMTLVAEEPPTDPQHRPLRKGEHDRRVWRESWPTFLRYDNGEYYICCQESRLERPPFDHPENKARYLGEGND